VRSVIAPGIATLVALAILLSLGTWQLQRRAWKAELIQKIEAHAYSEPSAIPPEPEWRDWSPEAQEYRRVRVSGRFLHALETPVHGLMSGERGRPVQGYYILTPLRLADGSSIIVNRGFVPTELRDSTRRAEAPVKGEVSVTGLIRAPEKRAWFVPENDPPRDRWFVRSVSEIAEAKGLERVAPFLIDADATPNPGGWPRGGQTRLAMPNPHLQYAVTWYGLALTLVFMFAAFVRRRLRPDPDMLVPLRPEP
jgi:surfeit locus 1 family protein